MKIIPYKASLYLSPEKSGQAKRERTNGIPIFRTPLYTMTDIQLYSQISSLPSDLKKEVSDFVEFLKQKSKTNKPIKERQFGYAKDFFKISADFDEPLEDFKEYM